MEKSEYKFKDWTPENFLTFILGGSHQLFVESWYNFRLFLKGCECDCGILILFLFFKIERKILCKCFFVCLLTQNIKQQVRLQL